MRNSQTEFNGHTIVMSRFVEQINPYGDLLKDQRKTKCEIIDPSGNKIAEASVGVYHKDIDARVEGRTQAFKKAMRHLKEAGYPKKKRTIIWEGFLETGVESLTPLSDTVPELSV